MNFSNLSLSCTRKDRPCICQEHTHESPISSSDVSMVCNRIGKDDDEEELSKDDMVSVVWNAAKIVLLRSLMTLISSCDKKLMKLVSRVPLKSL